MESLKFNHLAKLENSRHGIGVLVSWLLAALLLSACGGGGGGGDGGGDTRVEISGAILAPGGTVSPDNQLGLQTIANRPVALYRIDDEGKVIGDALDTTTSDQNGNYVLILPSNVAFSSDLIVEADLGNNETARAIVIDESTDVTPITEYITSKLVGDPALDLSALPLSEVVDLLTYIESLPITPQPNLVDQLAAIGDLSDLAVDNAIADINNPPPTIRLSGLLSVPSAAPRQGSIAQRPVPNETVEVYRIDNDGNIIGGVLATTTTDANGLFTLLLPAAISDLSGDLILQAVVDGQPVRSMIVNELINIDATTEYVYSQLVADTDLSLANSPPDEVQDVVDFIYGLNIPETNDLASSLADIDAAAGAVVDNQIDLIQAATASTRGYFADESDPQYFWGLASFH